MSVRNSQEAVVRNPQQSKESGGNVAARRPTEEKLRVKMEGILSDRISAAGAQLAYCSQTDSKCVGLTVL